MNKSESKYFGTALLMDEALLYLLEKKNFEFITVKEICKKAGVNRSTFYFHYENTNDLLAEATEMINKRFVSAFNDKNKKINIPNTNKNDLVFISPEYLTPYLEFIKTNKRIFRTICKNPKLFEVEKTLAHIYADLVEPILKKFNVQKENQVYIFEFYMHGILAIIMKWVNLDCADDIEHIQNLILYCVDAESKINNDFKCKI